MLDAPFLELQYYLERSCVGDAINLLVDGIARDVVPGKLVVPNVVGLSAKPEEIEVIGAVLVLRTEGEAFCGPARENRANLRKLGRRAYGRFLDVAERIQPTYGAILVEYSLEEPRVLRQDPRSLAFRNFFVNRSQLGQSAVDEVLRVAGDDTYIEDREGGVYVSMSAEFNPLGRGIPSLEAQYRSARISAIIGRAAR